MSNYNRKDNLRLTFDFINSLDFHSPPLMNLTNENKTFLVIEKIN